MGQFISFKSEINNPWFNPWFILLHTHLNVCATVEGRCLEYLVCITLTGRCTSSDSLPQFKMGTLPINKLSVNLGFVNVPRTTLCQQKHTKIKMLPWDFKLFIGIFVGIMVMGFIIIPIIKHLCCIWPRYKNGIGCAKKPCCVYFHFWDNEGKVQVFWKGHKKF